MLKEYYFSALDRMRELTSQITKTERNTMGTNQLPLTAEIDRLREINAELRAALLRIEIRSHDTIHSVTEARQWVRQFRDIARAAIAKATQP